MKNRPKAPRLADRYEPVRDPELIELGLPDGFLLPMTAAVRRLDPDGRFGITVVVDPDLEVSRLFGAPHLACA